MSIEKEFIPYKQSLELKELGFDEPCMAFYELNNREVMVVGVSQRYNDPSLLTITDFCAPLYQQAFRWFREKYKCEFHIDCRRHTSVKYYEVFLFDGNNSSMVFGKSLKYEQAELELLNKLIEIVKEK